MSEWFQAKVASLQQQSNGLIQKVTETFLIDAMSFTEAEARAMSESEGNREVTAVSISRSPIKEVVFYGDTDLWHKVKVCYSLMDEDTEKEKKVTTYFLVNAATVKEAYDRTDEHLKEMLVPFTIPKVEESPICEVFQYEKQAPKGFVKVEKADYESEEYLEGTRKAEEELNFEHEEDCAMEGDSVSAIDPTDGQAVAFEMDLATYLQKIRPTITIYVVEQLRNEFKEMSFIRFLGLLESMDFTDDEAERISDILANDAAFEQDEEDNERDLESRLDAAMKGGGND